MARVRMAPDERKEMIIQAALDAAERSHYQYITREQVSALAGCSPALVSAYLGSARDIRAHVMREAVLRSRLRVVAQGLVAQDAVAHQASELLKATAWAAVQAVDSGGQS